MTLAFYLGDSLILNIYPTAGINLVVTVKQKTLLIIGNFLLVPEAGCRLVAIMLVVLLMLLID